MKVYVVISVSGKDSVVEGVFSSRELAEMVIGSMESIMDSVYIEERMIDNNEDKIREGLKPYYILMDKDGLVVASKRWELFSKKRDVMGLRVEYSRNFITVACFAKDYGHAEGIAEEIRKQIIWDGIWCD